MRTCFLAMKNDLHKMKRRKTWNMKVELSCCKDDGQLKTQMKRKNTLKENTTITTLLILSKCHFRKAFGECNVTQGNASFSSFLICSLTLVELLLLFLLMFYIWLSIHVNRYFHLFFIAVCFLLKCKRLILIFLCWDSCSYFVNILKAV